MFTFFPRIALQEEATRLEQTYPAQELASAIFVNERERRGRGGKETRGEEKNILVLKERKEISTVRSHQVA